MTMEMLCLSIRHRFGHAAGTSSSTFEVDLVAAAVD